MVYCQSQRRIHKRLNLNHSMSANATEGLFQCPWPSEFYKGQSQGTKNFQECLCISLAPGVPTILIALYIRFCLSKAQRCSHMHNHESFTSEQLTLAKQKNSVSSTNDTTESWWTDLSCLKACMKFKVQAVNILHTVQKW